MRKYLAILGFAVALLLAPFFAINAVHAADFRGGNSTSIGKGEVIDSSMFIAGRNVDVAGEINGDLYCGGNSVTVTGTVHGDVLCAGQVVDIRGTVDGDVRVAGQTVTIGAKVAGNVSAAGQSVTFSAEAQAHDVSIVGQAVTINGMVARDVDIAGNNSTINGSVGRNAQAAGEAVALGTGAKIAGNFTYTSRQDVSKADGASVHGATRHEYPKDENHQNQRAQSSLAGLNFLGALIGLVTSLVLVALAPRLFYSLSSEGVQRPLLSAFTGLGAMVGGIIIAIILAFTIIGLPLGGLVLLAWIALLIVSMPVFSFYLGRILLARSTNNAFYYILVGAGIVFIAQLIPFIGGVVWLIGGWMGAGMVVLEVARRWTKPRYNLKATAKKA